MSTVVPGVLHVLIKSKDGQRWEDKTWDVRRVRRAGNRVVVTFASDKEWWYGLGRVRIYDQVMERKLGTLDLVYVNGVLKQDVTNIYDLRASDGSFEPRSTLVFPKASADEDDKPITCTYGKEAVTLDLATPNQRQTLPVMKYVREEVHAQARRAGETQQGNGNKSGRAGEAKTTPDAILANQWKKLSKAPSGSALEAYLRGTNSTQTGANDRIIMPFHSNIDQRNAIRAALENQISVIDGPPGTGKTQTILNLIATLVMQGKTVGIVAGANSAVENVVDKLTEEGYGFLVATLGSLDRVTAFCTSQTNNDKNRAEWQQTAERSLKESPEGMTLETLRAEEERLVSLWEDSRDIAQIRSLLTDTQHERRVFEEKVRESGRTIPDISHLPVIAKKPEILVDLLALARCVPSPGRGIRGFIEKVRRYYKFGSLKGIDLGDTDVQSAIHAAFYCAHERELVERLKRAEEHTASHGLIEVAAEYRQHSRNALDAALLRRFAHRSLTHVQAQELRDRTDKLLGAYPVIASTCFSIRNNLAAGALLDWVIIDESSQVLLPQGMAALSKARNAVIVGDDKQLSPVFCGWDESRQEPPEARFDVRSLSLLDSVKMMPKSARVPNTLLKEHYRCHPAIIEFCNRTYYDGQLIPMRDPGADAPEPLTVVYAAPGNHARHPLHGGGRFSQREIDIIAQLQEMQVLREGIGEGDNRDTKSGDFVLGVVTPYRAQASEATKRIRSEIGDGDHARWLAETVHKFQGRGAGTVVLSTVLNANDPDAAKSFYDNNALTNVAVSRAKDRLIVVTTNGGVRLSRNTRELLDYIKMYDPRSLVQSSIVSIFDVLYQAYSESLERYSRVKNSNSDYSAAENVAELCLQEILAEEKYSHVEYWKQVPLKDALPHVRGLSEEQYTFVYSDSSLDFLIRAKGSRRVFLAIEVDGWEFHGMSEEQQRRDALKDSIMNIYGIPVLRLPTIGSGEGEQIREALDRFL